MFRELPLTGDCPECGEPSATCKSGRKSKIYPFCTTVCRTKHENRNRENAEDQLVNSCALVGEVIDNEGRTCLIVKISTLKYGRGNFVKANFESWWTTACGEQLAYPKGINGLITCLGCLAYDGPVKQIQWIQHTKDGWFTK